MCGNGTVRCRFPGLRSLGRGVAVDVRSAPLIYLRTRLAAELETWLTPQDRQKFQPHVTIQNKVTPEVARDLLERLSSDWQPLAGYGQAWNFGGIAAARGKEQQRSCSGARRKSFHKQFTKRLSLLCHLALLKRVCYNKRGFMMVRTPDPRLFFLLCVVAMHPGYSKRTVCPPEEETAR